MHFLIIISYSGDWLTRFTVYSLWSFRKLLHISVKLILLYQGLIICQLLFNKHVRNDFNLTYIYFKLTDST